MLHTVILSRQEVETIAKKIQEVTVCVVGDVCLDLYWRADMTRSKISRETPHYPLPVVEETYSPGGGGNVLQNIHALGVKKLLPVSAIGKDWRGYLLTSWMETHGIPTDRLLVREQGITPCYCKPLRMGLSDVVYEDPRLDFENFEPLSPADEEKMLEAIDLAAKEADIIAVCDQFTYGVITPNIRQRLSQLAETMPVVVDSRERIPLYKNVIVKPNEVEAAAAIGKTITGLDLDLEDYANIALQLHQTTGRPAVVTLGSQGALWCEENTVTLAPTVKATPPVDIVGAGDTFLSAFCCAYAACGRGDQALAFANLASGVTVKKIGTTGTATTEEIFAKWKENFEV